ncbi:MAG: DNA (cytosine-5-)-methyltransferase, partial [Sulfurovum sp.]|nr:DNA (cytosine-5-)-methyltransferase [Sulfurovum sp.]
MGEVHSVVEISEMFHTAKVPLHTYRSIELFAGAGGMALGMEKAGFHHVLLNDFDRYATATLKKNRPQWNVIHGDVELIDFRPFHGKVDLLTGGFPCQAFSYAGKKRGLEDTRGTLFYEFARALKETESKVFLAENVKGLLNHDKGRTLKTIVNVFEQMGYEVLPPRVLKAIHYHVPQKRERLFIVGIKKEISHKVHFVWPAPSNKIYTLKDALRKGTLFSTDVPSSAGQSYPPKKQKVLALVPPGGYWRDLPVEIQK